MESNPQNNLNFFIGSNLSASTIQVLKNYFNQNAIYLGLKFFLEKKITVSFQKGTPDTFFILSGILNDQKLVKTKVSIKNIKDENDESKKVLTSNCTCSKKLADNYCVHAVSLFIKYLLYNNYSGTESTNRPNSILKINQDLHAFPKKFGTIINAPYELRKNAGRETYSSLQYILISNRQVSFPSPKDFDHITKNFVLNIKEKDIEELRNNPVFQNDLIYTQENRKYRGLNPYINFFLIENENLSDFDDKNNINENISLFEHQYLFDWKTGEAYSLDDSLKDFIRKYNSQTKLYHTNDILRFVNTFRENKKFKLTLNNKLIEEINTVHPSTSIALHKSSRVGYIDLKICFKNKNGSRLIPSDIMRLFCVKNGLLSSFGKKSEAYEFAETLIESKVDNNTNYKKLLFTDSNKQELTDLCHSYMTQEELISFDKASESIVCFNTYNLNILMSILAENIGPSLFRFSEYDPRSYEVRFEVSKSLLFSQIQTLHSKLDKIGVNLFYQDKQVKKWNSNISINRLQNNIDWFELKVDIDKEDLSIIGNSNLDMGFHLSDDELTIIDANQKSFIKFLTRFVKEEKKKSEKKAVKSNDLKSYFLSLNRTQIFELFELKKVGLENLLTKEESDLCNALLNLKSIPKYTLSDKFKNIARSYQVEGFNWLRFLFEHRLGACLSDDMGLGKTLQTIMFLESVVNKIERVLIVCPVSILINWQEEIKKFSKLDVSTYYSVNREFNKDAKITLTSYGVMKKEAHSTFKDIEFDIIIFDEVQYLKNLKSLGSIAARNIKSKFKICLTGTPVENNILEFFNILDLSIPGLWGDFSEFRKKNLEDSHLIAKKVAKPFILRRTKNQVMQDLPPKIVNNVFLNFSDEENNFYKKSLVSIKNNLSSNINNRKFSLILKGILELRKLCLWQPDNKSFSTKLDFLMKNLEQITQEGHKALIFSQFTTYLDFIQNKLVLNNYKFSRLDGTQSHTVRQKQINKFQEGDNNVFLISLRAGGIGLNLTAASYVFIMDPWWNPAVENQAIDRAHRIGQSNKVNIYRPIIKDSIEEKVLYLQNKKSELFDSLMLNDAEYYNGKLSYEDFLTLVD